MDSEFLKRQVQQYWDEQPCDTQGVLFPEGSLEFFEKIEDERYKGQAFIHSFAQFTRWYGKKVLEIGCGCGTDLLQFARAGAEVYGIDLSKHSVELARKRFNLYGLKAEVNDGDGENLPFHAEQFDLVYSWGVLHHTPNPPKAVMEIYRVLKRGGLIKAMVYRRFSGMGLRLYLQYGLLKGKPFASLSELLSKHQESPGTKAFTIKEVKELFSPFSNLKVQPIVLPLYIEALQRIVRLHWLASLYPNILASWIAVEGQKPFQEEK